MIYLLNLLGVCIYYGRPAVYIVLKRKISIARIQLAHFLFLHIFFLLLYAVKYEQDGNETRVSRLYNNSGGVVMKKNESVLKRLLIYICLDLLLAFFLALSWKCTDITAIVPNFHFYPRIENKSNKTSENLPLPIQLLLVLL